MLLGLCEAVMLIIIGVSERKKGLGQELRPCSHCGRETFHTLEQRQPWFSFFFIPIFPVESPSVMARCNLCGRERRVLDPPLTT